MAAMGSRGDIYKANQTLIGQILYCCFKDKNIVQNVTIITEKNYTPDTNCSKSLDWNFKCVSPESSESEDTETTMRGGRPRSSNSMLVSDTTLQKEIINKNHTLNNIGTDMENVQNLSGGIFHFQILPESV